MAEVFAAQSGLAEEMLREIHDHWQGFIASFALACGPGCAVCCTDRVFMATLEARALARGLEEAGRQDLLARVTDLPVSSPPKATFNTAARAMLAGREPPAEDYDPKALGVCPLLEDGLCAAYEVRPLACRVMVSQVVCQKGGSSLQKPLWPLLATALAQVVEHLDAMQGGKMGLMPSVLAAVRGGAGKGLLPSQPLPGIPAPPEHQAVLQGFLSRLFARPVRGKPLGQWLEPGD